MPGIEFLECSTVSDHLYSISNSDLNTEGVAEKVIDGRCIGELEIYNDVHKEIILHFTQDNVVIRGKLGLENIGKVTLDFKGNYKFQVTSTEKIDELVIRPNSIADKLGWIKDVTLEKLLITKGKVRLERKNVIGRLDVEEVLLNLAENSELISHEVMIKSVSYDAHLKGKIIVQNYLNYNGKCITLDKGSSIISKSGDIDISLLDCNVNSNGHIWSGKDFKLEIEKGYLINKRVIGVEGIGSILLKGNGEKLVNSGKIQGGVDFSIKLELNGKIDNEKDGVINGKDNIKITANSITNQAGAKISSVNGLQIESSKLINSGAIYYKEGELNIKDALVNNGVIVGEASSNIRTGINGKIENEKNGVISGKDNIKITANSITNQAGAKISSVNGLQIESSKLINSGAIYYQRGVLNIKDVLINHAIIVGEASSNIRMGVNGEIHNNENARIKLGGKVYIGNSQVGNISLLRNYAASIIITGEELTLNVNKIENIVREEGFNEKLYVCRLVSYAKEYDTGYYLLINPQIQSISHVKASIFRIESSNIKLKNEILFNQGSLFYVNSILDKVSKLKVENIARSLMVKEHWHSYNIWGVLAGASIKVNTVLFLRGVESAGKIENFVLEFECVDEKRFRSNSIDELSSRTYYESADIYITKEGNDGIKYMWEGDEACKYGTELSGCNTGKKHSFTYKSYPSTVVFTDVEGARLVGLANYAVAKSNLPKLLDQFNDNNNALVPYDFKSQEIEGFKLAAVDMMNNLRKEGYEIRLDNAFNFGNKGNLEASFLRSFFEQYNPGIYKVNTPSQLAIGSSYCTDSCANNEGIELITSSGLIANYVFESIFELPGVSKKGTAYLLKELGYSTDTIIKILADPDYEHEVLKRAIFDKLGKAYIWNHKKNDDEEFDQLLRNAVEAKKDLGLIPGIELTRWQQSELVNAILWPVKENINGIMVWSLRLYVTEEILKDGYSSATIALKDTKLMIDEDVFNGGLIDSIDNTFIEARNIYQLNQIRGEGSLSIEARGSFIMEMLVKVVEQYTSNSYMVNYIPLNKPEIDLTGSFKVNSKGSIGIKGGEIKADNIAIESEDKVIVIPAAIYNKLYYSWDDGYSRTESLEYELAKIMARGDIKIVSNNGNYLYSPVIKAGGEFELEAKLGKNVIEAVANKYIRERYSDDSWFVFSSESYSYSSITNVIRPIINAAKKVLFGSLEDTAIRAALITTSSMEIKTGSGDVVGLISLLPGKDIAIKEEREESDYVIRSKEYVGKAVTERIIPTIIQINNNCNELEDKEGRVKALDGTCATFIGYGSGGWLQLASSVEAERIEIKAPKGIKLVAAPNLDFSYAAVDKKGIGFTFTSNSREQSVGLGIKISKSRETISEEIQGISSLIGHFITLDTDETIYTEGAYIKAEKKLITRSKLEIHDVVYDTKTHSQRKVEGFLGLKLGIQNSIAGLIESGKSIDKGLRQGGKEGVINTAFAAWDAYNTLMGLAAGGGLFQGGVWISASYQESSSELDSRIVRFTKIEVGHEEDGKLKEGTYESTSEELRLKSTQIQAYDAYFNTNKLTINTANNEFHSKSQGGGINIQVGTSGTIGSSVSGNTGKLSNDEIVPINAQIHVTNRLVLKVNGHADIRGASITATSLEASFKSLILESVKELEESSGKSFGLSIGWGKKVSHSLGGSFELSNGKRNVVGKLTELIGYKDATVIVAHALELNGAMITNAQIGDDGKYTDLGNLVLTVGELFVKHVYDSDEGYTLGASIDYITGNKGSDGKISKYEVVFGGRNGDGYTFATIGKGEVRCTESGIGKVCEIEKANRDVSKTSSFDYDYKIETIRAKFSVLDEETKKKAIENLKSGKFFENIATSFMSAIGEVEKVINDLLPKEKIKEIDEEFKKKEVNKEHEDKKSSKEIKGKKNTAKKSDNIQDGGKQDNRQDDPSQGDNGKLNEEKASTDNKKLNPVQAMEKRIDSLDISSNEKTEAKYLLRKSLEEINMMSEAEQNKLAEEIKNRDKFSILDIFIPKAEAVVPAAIGACLINPWCAALLLGGAAVISSKLQDAIKNKPSYQVGINLFEKDDIGKQKTAHLKQGSAAATGTPDPDDFDFDPDEDDGLKQYEKFKKQDGSGRYECKKPESPVWKKTENFKDQFRTNGLKGKEKEYYRWDKFHKDIEVYDNKGRYIGSRDPVTGKQYRTGDMQINKILKNILK
ncbi:hypothetical protein N3Z17_04705 [Candidatus Bandiella numerosa]|uniref:hypothetical protein n=1 Tax=Candidatus Bandiella numerosa TaxID=2570586 RepID=UPI00249E206E|nr:hypothetical protein [Candidatus Bandiella numerosa]WHA04523.1 hypothetical protein N3Z17_04705 [Candidatus Bandiella numerosa]